MTTQYNITTATPAQIEAHAVKAVRAQGTQTKNLHADIRALLDLPEGGHIESIVDLFAKELQADKDSCAKSNKALRASIKIHHAQAGLEGDKLKAAVKAEYDASTDKKTASYINWDNLRRAIERANGKDIKTTVSTDGTYKTEEKAAAPTKAKQVKTSELLDTVQVCDRIRADINGLMEIDAFAEIKALTDELINIRNAMVDAHKQKQAA